MDVCRAVRVEWFNTIPSVLMIQLLIFNNDCEKVLIKPSIPQELSSRLLGGCNRCIYCLASIVEHVGTTLDSGHYINVIIQPNGKFVVYDDTLVLY